MAGEQVDIVVVDDDPVAGSLEAEIISEMGLTVALLNESSAALATIKSKKPKLVILDIMMPGMDGMAVCQAIRSDSAVKDTKIIFVSGKAFSLEKIRAQQLGVVAFIQKPYDIKTFTAKIKQVLTGAPDLPPPPGAAGAQPAASDILSPSALGEKDISVRFWGCRGYSPLMPASPSRYGRQTPCVSVELGGKMFIFDGGTGLVNLGRAILKENVYRELWVLLTHFHSGHIAGISGFAPAQDGRFTLHFVGANDPEKKFKAMLGDIFYGSCCWAGRPPKAKIKVYEAVEGSYVLAPGIKLYTLYAHHPSTALAFRLEGLGKKIVYAPDSELLSGDVLATEDFNEKFARYCKGADILIHDSTYNEQDFARHKKEGHSGALTLAEFAAEAGVKKLVLFHYDGGYADDAIDRMKADCLAKIQERKWPLALETAAEGGSILITG